jgi:sulfofructose kinase
MSVATVICVGIAVMDQVLAVERLPCGGGKHRARDHVEVGGGQAASGAVTVARLGGRAAWWGRVGDDPLGARILDDLEAEGVDVSGARQVPGAHSQTAFVVVDRAGERQIVSHVDPGLDADPGFLPLDQLDQADVVLVDARWPEGSAAVLQAARAVGLATVLDAEETADNTVSELAPLATHVIFSEPGLEQLTGTGDPAAGLRMARELGPRLVAVTRGAGGCLWLDEGMLRHTPAFEVDVVDTLGAGDVFHGAFALALAEGLLIAAGLRLASAAAALKCTRFGGRLGIPSRGQAEALLREQS